MSDPLLLSRLRLAVLPDSIRRVAARTEHHPETVRRYMSGENAPSCSFITAICREYNVLGNWLLLGEGPRTKDELMEKLLVEVKTTRVLESLADKLGDIEARLESVESQAYETARTVGGMRRSGAI